MADVLALIGIAVFFAISVLFVIGCDRIIGPDTDDGLAESDQSERFEISGVPGVGR